MSNSSDDNLPDKNHDDDDEEEQRSASSPDSRAGNERDEDVLLTTYSGNSTSASDHSGDDDSDEKAAAVGGTAVQVLVQRRRQQQQQQQQLRPHHHRPKKQKDSAAVETVSGAAASLNDLPEDEYRRRVYGTTGNVIDETAAAISTTGSVLQQQQQQQPPPRPSSSLRRRLSRSLSRQWERRRSSLQLPETPAGWTVLLSATAGAVLSYEIAVQRQLTAPPVVYGQGLAVAEDDSNNNNNNSDAPIRQVYRNMLKQQPDGDSSSIITRPIQPSLFVGTRSLLSSAAAYCFAGPHATAAHVQFREIFSLPADGARLAIDWELPPIDQTANKDPPPSALSFEHRQQQILHGPIRQPVVLILHGINNHAGFGYVKSMMRACTDAGWIAAGLNFRGCGGVPLQTPRLYNGAYTGDLRSVVHFLSRRFRLDGDGPLLFLVGNSLGANLVAKYLGEEGRCGSLPACVAGGVTMGNPMKMYSGDMNPVYSPMIAAGAKRGVFGILKRIRGMCRTQQYRDCIWNALTARNLADFDEAMAPIFVRNDPDYPFAHRIGYNGGGARAYGWDASSYRQVPFVSVPLLQLIAKDDFLVFHPFSSRMAYNLCNPNVMVMQTTCGGHLGWHEAPPNGWGLDGGTSWADTAMVDFIQAVLDTNKEAAAAASSSSSSPPASKAMSEQQSGQRRVAQNTELRSRL